MTSKTILAALMLCAATISYADTNAQTEPESKGTTLETFIEKAKDISSHIHINAYAQGGYDYNSSDNSNTFNFKRAIAWVSADINKHFSCLYMHDFKTSTLEYYLTYTLSPAFKVRMGQFKNALTMENPMSPSKLELIDCNTPSVKYMAGYTDPLFGSQGGRDIGIQIYGQLPKIGLSYEFQVMNGQGINKSDGNREKDFILKLDYRIIDPLRIVVSGQIGRGHAIATNPFAPDIEIGDNYKRHRITAGAEYLSTCFNLRAEYLKGWNGDAQTQGVYATLLKPLCKRVDAIASFDWLDKNTHMDARQADYAVGLQYWFGTRCRLQAMYTRCCPSYQKDYNVIQVQTQVGF